MKLYYSPGACSLSPHIVARETGVAIELVKVDLKTKRIKKDGDFMAINANGYVPVLELDDGTVLTEGPAIVQFLADKAGRADLLAAPGALGRYRVLEWLNFITSELHKGFSPLFNDAVPEAYKVMAKERLAQRLGFVNDRLTGGYLTGPAFTVADAYAFTVMSWGSYVGLEPSRWPRIAAYLERVAKRPAVAAALAAEKG